MVEGVEEFAGGEDVAAEGFHLAAGGGVGDYDGGGMVSDEAVANRGGLCGDVPHGIREGRDHDESPFSHGRTAVNGSGWNLPVQSAGETPDDRVQGPKEDAQALLFHRGMEAADNRDALFPESLGKVVGVEDEFTGTLDRTEQSNFRAVENGRIADDAKCCMRRISLWIARLGSCKGFLYNLSQLW